MSWSEAFLAGAGNVFSWPGILIPVAGTLLAMVTSFLPGIGNASLAVLVLVATMSWDPVSALLMFGALTGGATFMGSITAILFNIPGNVSSTPTLLDGHPMARQGLARTAIACAATASAVGSLFGVLVLLAVLPAVQPLLLQFGPLERLLVGLWGLVTIIAIPSSSRLKAAAMTALGLLAASVGVDPASGQPRWDFGLPAMSQGFNIVAVMLGLFTFAELVEWMRKVHLEKAGPATASPQDSTRKGIRAVFQHWGLTLRCSAIGTLVGMIPGVGGTVAGFVAYGHAAQGARDKSSFGQGDIRGVIAPEAAIDAKDGGSLLPALAFGLPGSEAGVALIALFAIHGIVPGIPMLTTQLPLTFTLIFALLFSNILTSIVGVALTPWLARLRDLRIDLIALPCLIAGLVTVVQVNGQLFDLYTAAGFGIAAYFWRRHDWPRAPFVIAFILGSLIETNLTLTVQLVELGRVQPLERPAALVLGVLIVLSLLWMRRNRTSGRKADRAGKAPDADLPLGAMVIVVAGSLLAIALAGGASYTGYAKSVAAGAFLLVAAVLMRAVMQRKAAAPTGFWWTPLAPPPAHRLPLWIVAALPVLVWATGLVAGIALTVFAWHAFRAGRPGAKSLAVAAALSAVYAALIFWFVNEVADVALPQGWLWQ
ncbi:tripartite tricarboxylate transporter permease [Caenimonas sp. SL110]|uniref:tripartite tricarboxylate transporter permease n=1 Tax=Caenimonas sp. SL110 TaxID=1450524 RepID=UPI000653B108|nr:tripartite tricarboxylate transporter permease [Caenimonas sp. SL110]